MKDKRSPMQPPVRPLRTLASLGLVALALCTLPEAAAQETNQSEFSTAVYVRTDSDRTTVVTPRLRLGAPVAEATRLDLIYTVDVWSSASIDIRTMATPRVVEQRDEINAGLSHVFGDLSVRGSYRYSKEYDYESHGGSLGASLEMAQKNSTLAVDIGGMSDDVGRVGDPGFSRPASLLSARASFTQIIDADTLAQLTYELARLEGYLSSPYRYIPIAFDDEPFPGRCDVPISSCIPEANPNERTRHAVAARARRSLGRQLSLGASYRFYVDDWDMSSHTLRADAAFLPDDPWLLGLAYRFYTQTAASHYQAIYFTRPERDFYTRDKELSPMVVHRLSLDVGRSWELDDAGSQLEAVLSLAPSLYQYSDFLPLERITALELTLAAGVRL